MKIIYVTDEKEVKVDDEDYKYLKEYYWCLSRYGYIFAKHKESISKVFIHRLIMGLPNRDKRIIDHINGDKLDNRKENLRMCNRHQNNMHKTITPNGEMRNVYKRKNGRFRVNVKFNRKSFYGGDFSDVELAKLEK